MIADATTIVSLQSEWLGVVKMRERMQHLVTATFAGAGFTAPALAKVVYNLPLLLAFDVLRQVLLAARDEKAFVCSSDQLGTLMDRSKSDIPWIDWDELRAGVRRRNEVAHDGKLFKSDQCIRDIANVENQLVAWVVIDPP
jgi:hypothetical protein